MTKLLAAVTVLAVSTAQADAIYVGDANCGAATYPAGDGPWDCGGDDDATAGIVDFLEMLAQWGGPGTCDFDGGGVGINDFLELLANWGPCP